MAREDLSSIDVSQLDTLVRLEADHRAIEQMVTKATVRRDREVDIYARVTADYSARMRAIHDKSAPVRQHVRDDLQKLELLCQRSEADLEKARAALQECEFRREIGEFTPEQYQQSLQAAEQAIDEREAECEEVRELRQRYLDIVPAAERLAVPPPPPSPPPAIAVAPPPAHVASAASSVPEVTHRTDGSAAPAAAAAAAGGAGAGAVAGAVESSTVFLPPPSARDFSAPSNDDDRDDDSSAYATMALSAAMLIEDRGGLPGAHHRLGMSTTIGRAPENEIVIPIKEVSRRHAQIVTVGNGYMLRDLGSPNGTFLNGSRVTGEQRLRDGDKITMGGKEFLFQGPS